MREKWKTQVNKPDWLYLEDCRPFPVDFYFNFDFSWGSEGGRGRPGVHLKNAMFGEFRLILTLAKLGILGIHLSHWTLCKLYESWAPTVFTFSSIITRPADRAGWHLRMQSSSANPALVQIDIDIEWDSEIVWWWRHYLLIYQEWQKIKINWS